LSGVDVARKKSARKPARRSRSRQVKNHLTEVSGGVGTEARVMDGEALLAADSIFCLYDEAEATTRAKS
jgi:hypothetical protein